MLTISRIIVLSSSKKAPPVHQIRIFRTVPDGMSRQEWAPASAHAGNRKERISEHFRAQTFSEGWTNG